MIGCREGEVHDCYLKSYGVLHGLFFKLHKV